MSTRPTVVLTGNDLTVEEIVAIGVGDKEVALDPAALERCRASRRFLEEGSPPGASSTG
jgi:histidine ammonia-lyase